MLGIPSIYLGDVFDCGSLEDPENGSVDLSNGTTEGSNAIYSCFSGYRLKGVATRTCSRNGWSDIEPTCERKLMNPLFPYNLYSILPLTFLSPFFPGHHSPSVLVQLLTVVFWMHLLLGKSAGQPPSLAVLPHTPVSLAMLLTVRWREGARRVDFGPVKHLCVDVSSWTMILS